MILSGIPVSPVASWSDRNKPGSRPEKVPSLEYVPRSILARMATKRIAPPIANKHQLRTQETRELLLQAAETIFVRDGYGGAELGEIAALAGRTKGAIYAQFKSKEDVFLALVEDRTVRYRTRMENLLAKSTSIPGNLAAYRQFALELVQDEAWALLLLEFKLYTVRHPESKKRLQLHYSSLYPSDQEKRYSELLGLAAKGKKAVSRTSAVHTLQPMLCALLLEAKFDTERFGPDEVKKLTNKIFDALLEVSSK